MRRHARRILPLFDAAEQIAVMVRLSPWMISHLGLSRMGIRSLHFLSMLSILYPFVRQFKNAEIFRSRVCQQRIITRTGAAGIPLRRFPVDPDVRFRIAKIWICAAAASADDVPNFHPNTVDFTFCRIQNRNRQVWILICNDVFCEPRFDPQIAKAAVLSPPCNKVGFICI